MRHPGPVCILISGRGGRPIHERKPLNRLNLQKPDRGDSKDTKATFNPSSWFLPPLFRRIQLRIWTPINGDSADRYRAVSSRYHK